MKKIWRKVRTLARILYANFIWRHPITFIVESGDWVIEEIGKEMVRTLNKQIDGIAALSYFPNAIKQRILHFASIHTIFKNGKVRSIDPSNKVILTWYHILPNDKRMAQLGSLDKAVDLFHIPCQITAKKLEEAGIDPKKIIIIPEGIDLELLVSYSHKKREAIKNRLGLPRDCSIIGSFQKDGIGWGEGLEPKLEKGPDVLCDVLEKLSLEKPIHVLLTGPARGYVKKRLEKAKISFTHHFLSDYRAIVDYYNALDLYLICSREEGGPRSVLESMACQIPLVSTRVGIAADILEHGVNGLLAEVEDVEKLVKEVNQIIEQPKLAKQLIQGGLHTAQNHDNQIIIREYVDKLYKKLIPSLF